MERNFDYTQKILVAVEFGLEPKKLSNMPPGYSVFQRLAIPEVVKIFNDTVNPVARLIAGRKFQSVLDKRMGYWETKIPAGQQCFVYYAIGNEDIINKAFNRLKETPGLAMTGVYHVEPQSSAYPLSFPVKPSPNHWNPGETHDFTKDSIFWFNFFPEQQYLFEKTFAIWLLFNTIRLKAGGECNQLVALDDKDRLKATDIDKFVQVNLNRFTSMAGYFQSAREAGKHTFTNDEDYIWYGMLLRKIL